MGNGTTVKVPLMKVVAVVVPLIAIVITATWTIQNTRQTDLKETADCIQQVDRKVTSNTRRIEALEKSMQGVPEAIASMSVDIRYLRRSVEKLIDRNWPDNFNPGESQ